MALLEVLQLIEGVAYAIQAWRFVLVGSAGAALAAVTIIFVPNIIVGITLGVVFALLGFIGGLRWQKSAAKNL